MGIAFLLLALVAACAAFGGGLIAADDEPAQCSRCHGMRLVSKATRYGFFRVPCPKCSA